MSGRIHEQELLVSFEPASKGNSSFSEHLPWLQLGVDSTSLGEYKTCPRKYFYSIILGLQPREPSVHLAFGLWMHEGRELYDRLRFKGQSHEDALDQVLSNLLSATWDKELQRPWLSQHKQKNRLSLIRSMVWYLEQFGKEDGLRTLPLANGQPAVELSFRFQPGAKTSSTGESWTFCGHLDRVVDFNGGNYIADLKTTTGALDGRWFSQFTPGNQFSMYSVAGSVAFGFEVQGLLVDGVQVGTGFTRFHRAIVPKPKAGLEEWVRESQWWLGMMDASANYEIWPMNDKSCQMYGGCQFQGVCSKAPGQREKWLRADFVQRKWDPLQVRGDF